MIDCSKCKHYRPNEVLIGKPDWWCDRYKRLMSDWTIGCNFSCNGFEILRAHRRDTGRPAALYGFIVADTILVVSENLQGIKAEAKKYADPNEVV